MRTGKRRCGARAGGRVAVPGGGDGYRHRPPGCGFGKRRMRVFSLRPGIHPHEAKDAPEDYLGELEALAPPARCVAVGK